MEERKEKLNSYLLFLCEQVGTMSENAVLQKFLESRDGSESSLATFDNHEETECRALLSFIGGAPQDECADSAADSHEEKGLVGLHSFIGASQDVCAGSATDGVSQKKVHETPELP